MKGRGKYIKSITCLLEGSMFKRSAILKTHVVSAIRDETSVFVPFCIVTKLKKAKYCVLPLSLLWYKSTWCVWERLLFEMSRLLSRCRWDGLHSMYNWLNKSRCLWVLLCKLCMVQKLHFYLTNCFHLDARHVQEVILGVTFSPCDEQTCRMTLMMRYFHRAVCEPSAKWVTRHNIFI